MLGFWERTFGVLVVLLLWQPSFVWAASYTLSFSGLPSDIDSEEPITLQVAFSGEPQYYKNKTYYLRASFYSSPKAHSPQYFGYIRNNDGSGWGNSSDDKALLFALTTDENGSASSDIQVRTDFTDGGYIGPGDYGFALGRYTSLSDSGADWTEEKIVHLSYVVPTPTPTPTITPTPTTTPMPTPTPTSTPKPTLTPTRKPSPESSPLETGEVAGASSESADIAAGTEPSPSPTPPPKTSSRVVPWMILGGSFLVAAAVIPAGLQLFGREDDKI